MLDAANPQQLELLTVSAFRAFELANGREPNWEHAAMQDQMCWESLCKRAEAILTAQEGGLYSDAADRIHAAFYAPTGSAVPWASVPLRTKLAWEAVARHMTALIDAEEIDDLDGLERSWRSWVELRLRGNDGTSNHVAAGAEVVGT